MYNDQQYLCTLLICFKVSQPWDFLGKKVFFFLRNKLTTKHTFNYTLSPNSNILLNSKYNYKSNSRVSFQKEVDYFHFGSYFLIIPHLVPKKKKDFVFVPTVISLMEIVYVKDRMHRWHNKC